MKPFQEISFTVYQRRMKKYLFPWMIICLIEKGFFFFLFKKLHDAYVIINEQDEQLWVSAPRQRTTKSSSSAPVIRARLSVQTGFTLLLALHLAIRTPVNYMAYMADESAYRYTAKKSSPEMMRGAAQFHVSGLSESVVEQIRWNESRTTRITTSKRQTKASETNWNLLTRLAEISH